MIEDLLHAIIQPAAPWVISLPDWGFQYTCLMGYLLTFAGWIVLTLRSGRRRLDQLSRGICPRGNRVWKFLVAVGILWPWTVGAVLARNLTDFSPEPLIYGWELLATVLAGQFLYGVLMRGLFLQHAQVRLPPETPRHLLLNPMNRVEVYYSSLMGLTGPLIGAVTMKGEASHMVLLASAGMTGFMLGGFLMWRWMARIQFINTDRILGGLDEEAVWPRLTTLESTVHNLQRIAGRTRVFPVTILNWNAGEGSVPAPSEPDAWRLWFSWKFSSLWLFFGRGAASLPWQGVRAMPPEALEAALSVRICGMGRSGIRRFLGSLWAPGRMVLRTLDRISSETGGSLLWVAVLAATLCMVVLFNPNRMFQPWRFWALGAAVAVPCFVIFLNTLGPFAVVHGFRGWRKIFPGGESMEPAEAVAIYITHLAIHEAISRDIRRPEVMVPLMLSDPKIRRLLTAHRMTSAALPLESIAQIIADAIEEFGREAQRSCRKVEPVLGP